MDNFASKALLQRPKKVFYGWWIVAIGAVVGAVKQGTFSRGFSFYILPIRNELGIGIAAISLAEMLGRLQGGFGGPVMGYLTDRLGPRAMMIFGGVASGLGFILLSLTHSYLYFILVFVGFLTIGFRSGNNAADAAVNIWFHRKRSLAMSIVAMGNGLGGLFAPLVALMVLALGWRQAALISGIATLVVIVPLSLLIRRSPESMGLRPDGAPAAGPAPERPQPYQGHSGNPGPAGPAPVTIGLRPPVAEVDFSAREAMRTASYWLLVAAAGFRGMVSTGVHFLLAPVMVWFLAGGGRGEREGLAIAGFFVFLLSLGALVFSPCVGWLGDRWSKERISAVTMVAGAVALVALLNRSGELWQLGVFAILLAMSDSASPLTTALMGDYFGRRSFATLRGWQHLPDNLMGMGTPVWMGYIHDRTGSYLWSLIPLAVIFGLSALFFWILRRPRAPGRPAPGLTG